MSLSQMSDAELMAELGRQKLPRGIRNNNPGNIEDGEFARSIPGYQGSDGRFAVYDTLDNGKAAHASLLRSYGRKGINTVDGVVNRWAPPTENDSRSYAQFVSQKMGVDPRAPLNMDDDAVLAGLAAAMTEKENGPAGAVVAMSDDALMSALGGAPKPKPLPGQPGSIPYPAMGPGVTIEKPGAALKPDQKLGFMTELQRVAERLAPYSPANLIPGFREANAESAGRWKSKNDQAATTRAPGKIGAFGADVLLASALGGPTSPLVSGMIGGAATGSAKDAKGLATETLLGGLVSGGSAAASDAIQLGARRLLSKAPKVMDLPALEAAKKALYAQVNQSGHVFGPAEIKALAKDFAGEVREVGGPKAAQLIQFADAFSARLSALASQKGGVKLTQLEKLRGDIYDNLIEKGGQEARLGALLRAKIDEMMDASPVAVVREARVANTRWEKARLVDRKARSADIRAEKDYGGDFGRKMKDRIFPLIDPDNPSRNLHNATPDERAALQRIATGGKRQNAASTVGGMMDPRRLGGKIMTGAMGGLTGGTALATGGASLPVTMGLTAAQIAAGLGLTGYASGVARKNVKNLMDLIAVGGSKQALKPVPTKVSHAVETGIARAGRPAAVAASVPALAAARRDERRRKEQQSSPRPKR